MLTIPSQKSDGIDLYKFVHKLMQVLRFCKECKTIYRLQVYFMLSF